MGNSLYYVKLRSRGIHLTELSRVCAADTMYTVSNDTMLACRLLDGITAYLHVSLYHIDAEHDDPIFFCVIDITRLFANDFALNNFRS